ncbi:MAG: type II/IV secretion system protein [Gammaproteobacteria bacterium]|nr:type II/IV secretion system protein [Gammaproteobacteria bacterium]MBM4233084.1 type II/IV secretion system protein [Gammaproteobacteria bacterium]
MIGFSTLLIDCGVQQGDLDKAQAYQSKYGGRLEQILVNMGGLASESLPGIYARLLGHSVLVAADVLRWQPPDSIDEFPLEFLVDRGWLPYAVEPTRRTSFVTRAPLDLEVNDWLRERGGEFELLLVSEETFGTMRSRLGRFQNVRSESGMNSVEEGRLRELASEAPTVNLLNSLLARALRQGASDLHFEPQGGPARVRFRIDGVLHEVDTVPSSMVLPIITRLKILAGMDIGERRRPQDGKIEFRVAGEDIDIRASVLPVSDGESAVLRFLRKSALVYDMKELGLSEDIEQLVIQDLAVTSGVILLTGPTGSGKTTTLYTFLSRLNRPEVKIITLEDPIEYQLAGINQVQVQPAIGFHFANGLRSIVRQDPDIIMVGEIRDKETAGVAMQSALTGHLVFSTVHTNDTPSAYTRLLDLGVEEFLLNAALRSIIGQRLARRLCVHCATPHPESSVLIADLNLQPLADRLGIRESRLLQAKGCEACAHTGYKGRVAVAEYLRCDEHIRALPKGADFLGAARAHAHSQGWRTLLEDGFAKALRGVTTVAEVLRVAG